MSEPTIYERPADFVAPKPDGQPRTILTALLSPAPAIGGQPSAYSAFFPSLEPRGYSVARSIHPVPILDSQGRPLMDNMQWLSAIRLARDWQLSPELLFVGRPLRLAVDVIPNTSSGYPGMPAHKPPFQVLRAVMVGGEFDKFPALEEEITKLRGWFA